MTCAQLRAAVRRAVIAADPEGAEQAARNGNAEVRQSRLRQLDGMAQLTARPRGLLTLSDCLLTQAEEGDAHSLAAVTGRPSGGLVVSARGRTGVASRFAHPTGCLADIRTTDVGDSCGCAVPRGGAAQGPGRMVSRFLSQTKMVYWL
jgi:hypothetical protein